MGINVKKKKSVSICVICVPLFTSHRTHRTHGKPLEPFAPSSARVKRGVTTFLNPSLPSDATKGSNLSFISVYPYSDMQNFIHKRLR